MITFENVTKVYPDETVAIEDITFEVEQGTTTVFVGPSGCGKTTTMTLVNRLEEPTEGTVYYDGTNIQRARKGRTTTEHWLRHSGNRAIRSHDRRRERRDGSRTSRVGV